MKKISISLLLVFLIILSSCGGKVTDTTVSLRCTVMLSTHIIFMKN